jgi:LysM repeat protein
VMPGDTLWSIAEEIAPGTDPRDVVDALQSLNLLDGGVLMVGEELAIPAAYAG